MNGRIFLLLTALCLLALGCATWPWTRQEEKPKPPPDPPAKSGLPTGALAAGGGAAVVGGSVAAGAGVVTGSGLLVGGGLGGAIGGGALLLLTGVMNQYPGLVAAAFVALALLLLGAFWLWLRARRGLVADTTATERVLTLLGQADPELANVVRDIHAEEQERFRAAGVIARVRGKRPKPREKSPAAPVG